MKLSVSGAVSQKSVFYFIFTHFDTFYHNKSGNSRKKFLFPVLPDLLWFFPFFPYRIDLSQDKHHYKKKRRTTMKDTLKKIIAITAVCLIAAQSVKAAPIDNTKEAEITFCDDDPYRRPIKI